MLPYMMIAKAMGMEIAPEDLERINRYTQTELTAGEIFLFKLHACDNDLDRDTEVIPPEELSKLAELYEGKTIIADHLPRAANQLARIYRTEVEKTDKLTQFGEPLYRLAVFCYTVRTDGNKDFIREIEAGIKREVSIGCKAEASVCSICGTNRKGKSCPHKKGVKYGGKLCYWLLKEFSDAYEISFVAVPAQRQAGVTKEFAFQKPKIITGGNLMGKEYLKERIKALTVEIDAQKSGLDGIEDIATYKGVTTAISDMEAERESLKSVLLELETAGDPNETGRKSFKPMATYKGATKVTKDTDADDDDPTSSNEYRKAFQQHVLKNVPMPDVLKANQSTLTTDVATAIPTVLLNRIIDKMETIGMILPLVTKTSYTPGLRIPTAGVKPVATWVAEGKGSDRQKSSTGEIVFAHFKLRCEISRSMETSVMALSAFENWFVGKVSEAMVKARENAILTGTGTGQPTGILKDAAPTGQALTAKTIDYKLLVKAEAALQQAYENGARWCMTKKTFMEIVGMTDSNGQPVARVNYGVSNRPERYVLGREVVLCGDYMDSFSDALTVGKIFAFIYDFSDYVENTIYDMGVTTKQDWDTEDWLTKAVMSVDGKPISRESLVTIAKGA